MYTNRQYLQLSGNKHNLTMTFDLKIGTLVIPALKNVHTNFRFATPLR